MLSEKVYKELEELKKQGFELNTVYSDPYAKCFIFKEDIESPVDKKLRESNTKK